MDGSEWLGDGSARDAPWETLDEVDVRGVSPG